MKNKSFTEAFFRDILIHSKGCTVVETAETAGKINVENLKEVLNNKYNTRFGQNSVAIWTAIRLAHNHCENLGNFEDSNLIARTYNPAGYVFKVRTLNGTQPFR